MNPAGSKCEPKKKKNTKPDGKNVKSDEQEAKKEAKKKVAKTGGGKKEKSSSKNHKEPANKKNEPQAVITEEERAESRQKTGKQVEAARQKRLHVLHTAVYVSSLVL